MKRDPLADILSVPKSKNEISDRERVNQRLNALMNDLIQIRERNLDVPGKDQELAYYLMDLVPQISKVKKEIINLG